MLKSVFFILLVAWKDKQFGPVAQLVRVARS
jgi:hypothetical protein